MNYYTYMYLRDNGTPYYVGKGCGNRAFRDHNRQGIFRPKDDARIFIQYWGSEEESFEMEKWWIQLFGRKDIGTGILHNKTDGGENPPRMLKGSTAAIKLGNTLRGKKRPAFSEEWIANLSEAHKGKSPSKEHRIKLSAANKGIPWSDARRACPVSQETRDRISAAGLGRITSQETKDKMRKVAFGRKHTKATKEKMKETAKGGHGRWHVARGVVNLECKWCRENAEAAHV